MPYVVEKNRSVAEFGNRKRCLKDKWTWHSSPKMGGALMEPMTQVFTGSNLEVNGLGSLNHLQLN